MRTGALTAGVVLFFLCSMIFTNFGFYSCAGSLSVLIDVNEGKDANDDTFSFNMLATSPSLGMLKKKGSYTINVIPTSVDYSGGVIITDWYSDNNSSKESIKISLRFLSNDIRSESLKVIVHQKICSANLNCRVVLLSNTKIKEELHTTILRKAALLEKESKNKKKKK